MTTKDYIYDGVQVSQLTNNDDTYLRPVINNNGQVVWEHYSYGLYLYDGNGITQFSNNFKDSDPDLNNSGKVVWEAFDDYDYEIFL